MLPSLETAADDRARKYLKSGGRRLIQIWLFALLQVGVWPIPIKADGPFVDHAQCLPWLSEENLTKPLVACHNPDPCPVPSELPQGKTVPWT